MAKFSWDKPEDLPEPKGLDFKVIGPPLKKLTNEILEALLNDWKQSEQPHLFVFWGQLTACFRIHQAILKLVSKDSKYPDVARILGRSVIDAFFNVAAIADSPVEHARLYEIHGYRVGQEKLEKERESYEHDPDWVSFFRKKEQFMGQTADLLGLSADERENPGKHIPYWPTPSQMRKWDLLSDKTRSFLEHVYEWEYGLHSEFSHQSWLGMAMGVFATKPDDHWVPGKFESDAVTTGILFLLMILSEIEAVCRYDNEQKLRYLWTILKMTFLCAEEYYSMRYDVLLKGTDS